MKKIEFGIVLYFLLIKMGVYAQVTTQKPGNFKSITNGGTGSQPILNTIMHDLLDNKNTYNSNIKTIGSPYLEENYLMAALL